MRPWLGLAVLSVAVGLGTLLRVHAAFRTELFDGGPEGLLRADPGTLWYLLQRVVEGGGWPDASFGADPRVEHPALVDCWATFTVGHEFLLAALHRALPGVPLHRLCVVVMGAVMSLTAVGVYGLARELTGKVSAAALAALLFALTPAAYRTLGFVLMNEDLSLPLFAAHLWLAARAVRLGTARAAVLAAALGVLAAATWHGTTFLLALAYGCAALWVAWSGRALLPRPAALAFVTTLSLASLAIPVLRAKGFAVGLPVQLVGTAALAAFLVPRARTRTLRLLLLAALGLALALLGRGLGSLLGAGESDFAHVFELMLAKVRHLGVFPADPSSLSFDARIMWQGPFATLAPTRLALLLGGALLPALLAIRAASRISTGARETHPAARLLPAFVLAGLALACLVDRLQVLPGFVVPVAAACALAQLRRRTAAIATSALVALQALGQAHFFATVRLDWHGRVQREQTRTAVDAVRRLTEPDAAIATDPVLGGAILAHTGRRIAVQAKWESAATRARVRALVMPFHTGSVGDLHRALVRDLQCDYFLLERETLAAIMRPMSGLPRGDGLPRPGTAAATFCSDDPAELASIPGFRLVYRSGASVRYDDGTPTDNLRLFKVLR